jgi:pseudouridine synthase
MSGEQASRRGERLQKVLAHAGVASRRKCEELIVAGRVRVNGKVITELGTRVRPDDDLIEVDGAPIIAHRPQLSYFLLYKPVGYLSTVSDPHGRPTALSLVPSEERLYPVGRLDLMSEGLLLFTNDGELAHRLMHPRFEHEKEYVVLVQGVPSDEELARLQDGVHLEDGVTFVRAQVSRLEPDWRWRRERVPEGCSWFRVVLREGRKRQIRLMLRALGYDVERLIRVRMGDLHLGSLKPGQGRWLSKRETATLRQSAGLDRPASSAGRKTTRGSRVAQDHHRHRRPGGVGQEHRRRAPRR